MHRPALVIIIVGLVFLAVAAGVVTLMGPGPEPPRAVAGPETPSPAPLVREAARDEAPPPEAPRPAPRRPPAPKPEPAPAPVEAPPKLGVLRIDSDVAGAHVFIDRQYIGTTPVTAQNVTTGTHRLNVSAEGYEGIANTIEVSPGARDLLIKFRVVRLDAKIDVVHKHRFGSCKGRLVAAPRGLRFETADTDDAFSAGLLDLETFQVDYLEKNLRVKLRKGKRYDFADPEDNADRLFVFHRDVEKARERLEKGDPPAGE